LPAICEILVSESLLEFGVFQTDHYCADQDAKCSQSIQNGEARTYAPSEHFAEVPKIYRVADTGSDADSDQALFTVSGHDFGQATELRTAELSD